MKYGHWLTIEIMAGIIGIIASYFFPNNIIVTYPVLAIVIISAIMSIHKISAEDTRVEMNGKS